MHKDTRVLVLGKGRVGREMAGLLRRQGCTVTITDRRGWRRAVREHEGLLVACLHKGTDSVQVARHLCSQQSSGIRTVVELTTQSLTTVREATRLWERCAVQYFAGGLTGGTKKLAEGQAVFLLGPRPLPNPERELFASVGRVLAFPSAEGAVQGKLLHNYVLFAVTRALAFSIATATRFDVVDEVLAAIATGPAGRSVEEQSLVRDRAGRGITSYSARLVQKDVTQLLESFPSLEEWDSSTFENLRTKLSDNDDPWTHALMALAEIHARAQ